MKPRVHRLFKNDEEMGSFTVKEISGIIGKNHKSIYAALRAGRCEFTVNGVNYLIKNAAGSTEEGDAYAEEWEEQEEKKRIMKRARTRLVIVQKKKEGDVGWIKKRIPNSSKPKINGRLS